MILRINVGMFPVRVCSQWSVTLVSLPFDHCALMDAFLLVQVGASLWSVYGLLLASGNTVC